MGPEELATAVEEASRRADVLAAVGEVYADLQQEIDARKPRCQASGRCCRFEEFGHRLYVTTVELAAFVSSLSAQARAGASASAGCPFQQANLCSVHAIRPFGCRIFFCDASATDWQREHYERFHGRIKQLHVDLGVPYAYLEWRQALVMLGLPQTARPAPTKGVSLGQVPL